ncbi:MAG: GntR family transcriptional regulator [Kiritimatiellae bacterium]|nr:GntR family transcriptional regulator [Kiritimatiellia bacterium]
MREQTVKSAPQPPLASPRERVLRWLERAVESGEIAPGAAIPSERAVARLLGVAQNTAAAAIDAAEAQGLVVRLRPGARKRFVPDAAHAAVLASATIYAMGDLGLGSDGRPGPRWTDRYLSAECFSLLARTGRHVTILNSDAMTEACVDAIFRTPPAAMLITSTVAGDPLAMRALERCRAHGVPVVVHGNAPELRDFDRVYTDHRATGRALAEWLLARGRKRIVPFFPYIPDTFWARERLAGYADAMRAAGLKPLECAVFGTELPEDTPGEERFRVRKALATSKLLELGCLGAGGAVSDSKRTTASTGPEGKRTTASTGSEGKRTTASTGSEGKRTTASTGPDALLCLSDNWARVAIAAMRDLGLRPHDDILLAGHDNIASGAEFGAFEADGPDVTIDKHNETKAEAMAALLAARLAGELPPGPQCREHAFGLIEPRRPET